MQLPRDEIGISDILDHRECPRRMSAGMRRHTGQDLPERTDWTNAYGSAVHDAIQAVEDGFADAEAVEIAYKRYSAFLDPGDVTRLKEDIAKFHESDWGRGCRAMLNEGEIRVPLLEHGGRTIYFRGRIDRLYQRIDNPAVFIHVDTKSSKWPRTQAEVDADLQLRSYNWLIYSYFPECGSLTQVYDQLRHGPLTTRKTEEQREETRLWLQLAAKAVLDDDDFAEDGFLQPKWNDWCAYCPLKMDCPVVTGEMTRFSEATIRGLAPLVPVLKQDGSPGKRTKLKLDIDMIQDYVDVLPRVSTARKTLDQFEKEVRRVLRDMPELARQSLGHEIKEKTLTEWGPNELRAIHDLVGDDEFYWLIGLTKTSVESFYGKGSDRTKEIERLATARKGPPQVGDI